MESIIILIIIAIAFFLGRWDGRSEFKKHTVTVLHPKATADDQCRKSLMKLVESKMIFQDMIDVTTDDSCVQNRVEFYAKEKMQ